MKKIHDSKIVSLVSLFGAVLIVRFCFSNVQLMSGKVIEGNSELVFIISSVMAIVVFDALFKIASRVYGFPLLRHFGKNSLAYYGFHVPILDTLAFFGILCSSNIEYVFNYLTILLLVYVIIRIIRFRHWQWIIGE